jgi:hypothetical protein
MGLFRRRDNGESSRHSTTNAARAATLIRGIEASVTGDTRAIADIYTDEVAGWSPTLAVSSAAELAVELEDRVGAFTDVDLDLTPLDVGGDRACVEWVAHATHSGPVAIDDDVVLGPTGVRLSLRGVTVAEFDGDRIRSFRQYWDEVELLEQLGLRPGD